MPRCAPCSSPAVRAATRAPIRARARGSVAAPTPASPHPRDACASARATSCSCPGRECPPRGRARGSSPRRCRGNTGHGSPRRRILGTRRGGARANRPIRRRGDSSARRGGADPASREGVGRARHGDARRRRACSRLGRPADNGARPSRRPPSSRDPRGPSLRSRPACAGGRRWPSPSRRRAGPPPASSRARCIDPGSPAVAQRRPRRCHGRLSADRAPALGRAVPRDSPR